MSIYKYIGNLSIKNKIVFIILSITTVVLVSGFFVSGTWQYQKQKSNLVEELLINAKLVGDNCVVPLAFADNERALDVISSLKTIQSFEHVLLFDENGSLFAAFPQKKEFELLNINAETLTWNWAHKKIEITHPIFFNNKQYGTLVLKNNTNELRIYIYNYFKLSMLILFVLSFLAIALAKKMQQLISTPILALNSTIVAIAKNHDYTTKVEKKHDDEIGTLYDGFTNLLNEIQLRISERDSALSSYKISKEKLDLALESSSIGVWEWDLKTDLTIWDEHMEKIFGLEKDTFGQDYASFRACLHPDDVALTEEAVRRALEENIPYDIVYRALWPTGEIQHISAKAIVSKGPNGKAIKMTGVCINISELKQKEEELALNEKKFRDLFENLNEGFAYHKIVLDENGEAMDYVYLDINPAFTKLTGLQSGDVLGKSVKAVLPGIENDPVQWIKKYGKVATTGEEITFEEYSAHLKRWYLIHAFSPEKGKFAVAFSDITERKKVEEKVIKLNEELEQKVTDRTVELENKYLEVEKMNRIFIGRELKMIELKKKIEMLEEKKDKS